MLRKIVRGEMEYGDTVKALKERKVYVREWKRDRGGSSALVRAGPVPVRENILRAAAKKYSMVERGDGDGLEGLARACVSACVRARVELGDPGRK